MAKPPDTTVPHDLLLVLATATVAGLRLARVWLRGREEDGEG